MNNFTIDNMKKRTGLNVYVYNLFVDYLATDASNIWDICDIHLMKENDMI